MDSGFSEQVKASIAEHFGLDLAKLTPETRIDSLGIDSLSMIEFMFQMEDKFKIRMADSRTPLVTVSDVVAEIERAVRDQQPAG
jgi:acyl carrier protein